MPIITVKLATAVRRSFRVEQVAGMFDVPLEERVRHELTAEVPGLDEDWTIGAIVGPSGSGKTTLAKAAFGQALYKLRAWPRDRAIIDVLGERAGFGVQDSGPPGTALHIKDVTWLLASIGLGSPVVWLKPYHVLSGGEKFRADLARALLEGGRAVPRSGEGASSAAVDLLFVMDEFTSSLDRTLAKTTSAALARFLRVPEEYLKQGNPRYRFVAVTCHHDILPWLSPDWTVELGRAQVRNSECELRSGEQSNASTPYSEFRTPHSSTAGQASSATQARLVRGRPRKPGFKFRVERVPQAMWWQFEPFHYLSGKLAASATCYAAFWGSTLALRGAEQAGTLALRGGQPIAFCAVVAALGWPGVKRIQRLVTLPEFQGMGIGGKLLDVVAATQARAGFRVTITASHPAIIAHCSRSQQWRYFGIKKTGSTRQEFEGREVRSSVGRAVAAFEFVGPKSEVQGPKSGN